MRGDLGDKARLQHISDAILEIESYMKEAGSKEFMENSMMRYACIKQLEIIGEASNHISDRTKTQSPAIPWAQIVGMRNMFVHEYFGLDPNIVWDIINNDLRELKEAGRNTEMIEQLHKKWDMHKRNSFPYGQTGRAEPVGVHLKRC